MYAFVDVDRERLMQIRIFTNAIKEMKCQH